MSRVGRKPIELPKGVKAEVVGQRIKIEGPKGKLEREVRAEIKAELVDGKLVLRPVREGRTSRAFHGMERALLNNMVHGVSQGFVKELEVLGVGYRADVKGSVLNLALGHSHGIDFPLPKEVKGTVLKEGRETFIRLESPDKYSVGETAARIIRLRAPEPYKGKGVRYRGQVIKLKAGKAGKK